MSWLPREDPLLQVADYYSRELDLGDWGLEDTPFNILEERWGPFEVDLFATPLNRKCKLYYSELFYPSSGGVDAFTFDWNGMNVFACPPVPLIVPTIKHMKACRAKGLFICPLWSTHPFWPFLCSDGRHLGNFVSDWISKRPLLRSGPNVTSKTFVGRPKFQMLALYVDFSVPHPSQPQIKQEFCIHDGCDRCC